MMREPNTTISIAAAAWAGWMMIRAGMAKNMFEVRRRRKLCPSCGRIDRCGCTKVD